MIPPDQKPAWKQLPEMANFMSSTANGPLWGRVVDGHLELGFRAERRHCNPRDVCHGGMLLTFADMLLGFCTSWSNPEVGFLPTINLAGDFIAPAPLGAWVSGGGDVLRVTRNMAFVQGMLSADGTPCLRWNGTAKVVQGDRKFRIRDWLAL